MSGTVNMSLGLSSSLPEKAHKVMEKQGIVSILGSDCHQTRAAPSLRRTLSADMSSKKWLAKHDFSSPMKKTSSSRKLAIYPLSDSSESDEERPGQDEVWRSIQSQKKNEDQNSWSSILTQKASEDPSKLPPPYVHPLVKRRASSLSENSLKICTESLGSETGSDGFSPHQSSETGETEEDKEESPLPQPEKEYCPSISFDAEEVRVVKNNYNYSAAKKLGPRTFPPPLPSMAYRNGQSVHMQSRRNNGRLVLEAVSVPSQNCFRVHRQDGRLLFTFAEQPDHQKEPVDQDKDEVSDMEEDEVFDSFGKETNYDAEEDQQTEEEEKEEERIEFNNIGAKEIGGAREQAPKLSSGLINVHRSTLVVKSLMGLGNRNPTWTKFNKGDNMAEMVAEEEEPNPLPQSLPRPPRVARLIPSPPSTTAAAAAAATSLNPYDYFWRTKPTVTTLINPLNKTNYNKVVLSEGPKLCQKQQGMVLLRGNKADYLVPLSKSCKENRRSLLIWEPYCIASS
ncbi:hypothetical protein NMG60_11033454 [Bertholletia excelsa]